MKHWIFPYQKIKTNLILAELAGVVLKNTMFEINEELPKGNVKTRLSDVRNSLCYSFNSLFHENKLMIF